MLIDFYQRAKDIIQHASGRATPIRIRVLGILLAKQQAVSHEEIACVGLGDNRAIDRVTLYRVLEWLNKKNLVHKIASDDRKWRFLANITAQLYQHAHFKCTACKKIICLDGLKTEYKKALPDGYQLEEIELTVKGLCVACA